MTTFDICQDVLNKANLLHIQGLDDSQSHTTVENLGIKDANLVSG